MQDMYRLLLGLGATLYIRPYMFGSKPVIGVKPADEYQFRVFATPVGPYFKGGAKPVNHNYRFRFRPCSTERNRTCKSRSELCNEPACNRRQHTEKDTMRICILDPGTRTKVEETGGANFIFVTKDNKVVTPKSSTHSSVYYKTFSDVCSRALSWTGSRRKRSIP